MATSSAVIISPPTARVFRVGTESGDLMMFATEVVRNDQVTWNLFITWDTCSFSASEGIQTVAPQLRGVRVSITKERVSMRIGIEGG